MYLLHGMQFIVVSLIGFYYARIVQSSLFEELSKLLVCAF